MWRWWWKKSKRKVQSVMAYYDRDEINAVFSALNSCPGCDNYRRDMVVAKALRVVVDLWAGKTPVVPTREELLTFCCKFEGRRPGERTLVVDTTQIHGGRILPGEPLPP